MKFWFDTEFVERGPEHPIVLMSIGIVAEDGREFYRQNREGFPAALAHPWVQGNVVPHLTHLSCYSGGPDTCEPGSPDCPWRHRVDIAWEILQFCRPETYGKPEFWAYYADYDWVVFCQIFGSMIDLPAGFPRYCRDIKQDADRIQSIIRQDVDPNYKLELPVQGKSEHHALEDARWNVVAHEFLDDLVDSYGLDNRS